MNLHVAERCQALGTSPERATEMIWDGGTDAQGDPRAGMESTGVERFEEDRGETRSRLSKMQEGCGRGEVQSVPRVQGKE